MDYTFNQRVRFTVDNLGTTRSKYESRVTEHKVKAGDTGTYIEPHEVLKNEDWHIVAVNLGLGTPPILYVPVHSSMIEPA
jgi:hypothetical protein